MATVKGDVHDIGKNIVGVILACNGWEVIDLGVMVPSAKILKEAKANNVDMIGLSGLITPSLDEMVHVAKEMQREGFEVPLLIGGATTSRVHTAVKIEEHYKSPVVHVQDASRSVPVASGLMSETEKQPLIDKTKGEYQRIREQYLKKESAKEYLTLERARANGLKIDFKSDPPPVPEQTGLFRFDDHPLEDLVPFIDWSPFFRAWELHGKYPDILTDKVVGKQATELFEECTKNARSPRLREMVEGKWRRNDLESEPCW